MTEFFVWLCFVGIAVGLVIGDYYVELHKKKANKPVPQPLVQCDVEKILASLEVYKLTYFEKFKRRLRLKGVINILDDEVEKYTITLAREIYESMSDNFKKIAYLVLTDDALQESITSSSFLCILELQQALERI